MRNVLNIIATVCAVVKWEEKFPNKTDAQKNSLNKVTYSVLITVQGDATQSSLLIILQVSGGVHKTVTTASGTGHAVLYSYLPPTRPS